MLYTNNCVELIHVKAVELLGSLSAAADNTVLKQSRESEKGWNGTKGCKELITVRVDAPRGFCVEGAHLALVFHPFVSLLVVERDKESYEPNEKRRDGMRVVRERVKNGEAIVSRI